MTRVSHETIYRSIYVQGRGELRRELARCLLTGRSKRRPRSRAEQRGCTPGHGDDQRPSCRSRGPRRPRPLGRDLIGKGGCSAASTLVERTTGYVSLLHLPDGRVAEKVAPSCDEE